MLTNTGTRASICLLTRGALFTRFNEFYNVNVDALGLDSIQIKIRDDPQPPQSSHLPKPVPKPQFASITSRKQPQAETEPMNGPGLVQRVSVSSLRCAPSSGERPLRSQQWGASS